MKEYEKTGWNKIVTTLQLPEDIVLGSALLNLTGNRHLRIENHKGILQYDESQIIISAKNHPICIKGKGLSVNSFTNDTVEITGVFSEIAFYR